MISETAQSNHLIYVASSWRNEHQPHVVALLRRAGHQVYDFRHPAPDARGFSWSSLTGPGYNLPPPALWRPSDLALALRHPSARRGHALDQAALDAATACVLLLPSGSSAHLEAGYCAGRSIPTVAYAPGVIREPELMYLTFGEDPILTTERALLSWIDDLTPSIGDLGGEA